MQLTTEELTYLSQMVLAEAYQKHNDYYPESKTAPLFQLGWRLAREAENQKRESLSAKTL